ncbi:MAG: hypothetical protein IPL83_10735 [Bdellovibrionales bacterium]|nr:hypothetical protein [Bdellovibrionales bacterium]
MMTSKIFSEQKAIEFRFLQFFEERGLLKWPEEPLIPRDDSTLLFTNATIVPLKPFLLGTATLPNKGVVLKQTCLRTQNLQVVHDSEIRLQYLSLISTLWVLVDASHAREIFSAAIDYLIRVESLGAERLMIRYSQRNDFFDQLVTTAGSRSIELECDSRTEKYYSWTYGIPGISGSGITFAILQNDGSHFDFGNLVEICSGDQVLGFEFGFGVETFLARKFSLGSPVLASLIHQPLADGGVDDEKLRDLLASSLAMISAGVEPGSGRQSSLLRKSLRSALFLSGKLNLSLDHLQHWLQEYAMSGDTNYHTSLSMAETYLEKYGSRMPQGAV